MGSTNHPNCDSAVTPPANWPHPMPWASLPEPGGRGQPCPSVTKVQLAPSSPSLCLCRAFPSWPQAQDSCVPIALLGGAGRGQGRGGGGTELRPCGASTPHLLVPVDGLWVQGPSRGGVTVPPAVLTLEVETNSFIAGRVVGTAPALARGSDHHLCISLVGPRRTVVLGQVVHGVFQEEISEGVSVEQSRPSPSGQLVQPPGA